MISARDNDRLGESEQLVKGRQMGHKRRARKAFTLVELLVVILIISMLAAFFAPRMFKRLGKSKRDISKAKMAIIEQAVETFNLDCGRYPESLDELLEAPEGLEDKWKGAYLKRSDLLDAWDNPYVYRPEGEVNPGYIDIISFGADGQEGGEGDNADIYND